MERLETTIMGDFSNIEQAACSMDGLRYRDDSVTDKG
jgi:hypothetical protein